MKKLLITANSSSHRNQTGLTLIELMIAIFIGLLMVGGIIQISTASKESSRLQRNMGFVQENIRTSMEVLGRNIRQAGYYEDDNPSARILTAPAPIINVSAPTTDTDVAVTADGGNANNDEITLTFESNTDCLGQATPLVDGNRFAVNHYFILNERLMCRGNGNIRAQPLVEGVENMQILYGENTDGDPRSANRYVRPEQADPNNIVSVRIAMRYVSQEGVRPTTDTNQYALLDADAFTPPAGDRRMRREITTTIKLRN